MFKRKKVDAISEIDDGFVVKVDDRYVSLSKEAERVWELCEDTGSVAELVKKLSESYSDVTESRVMETLATLESLGLVKDDEKSELSERFSKSIDDRPVKKLELVKRKRLVGIFKTLGPFFGFLTRDYWIIVSYVLPWLVFLSYIVVAKINPFYELPYINYTLFALLLPFIALHELAHAIVSEKLGAKVKGMGLGVYQITFFTYADTSDSLLLKHKDRIKISLAGPAVNFISGLILVVVSALSRSQAVFVLATILFLSGLGALVPIFESDGYYALIDYGRVADPRGQVLSYLRSLRGKSDAKHLPLENVGRKQKVVLAMYLVAYAYSIILILYFFLFFLPVFLGRQMHDFLHLSSLGTFELASFAFGILYIGLLFALSLSFVERKLRKPLHRIGRRAS